MKKIERKKTTKKKRECRASFFRPPTPPTTHVITRRPVIIFLVVLFFSPREETEVPSERRASIEIVRGGWLRHIAGHGCRRRASYRARGGRKSRQFIATPE